LATARAAVNAALNVPAFVAPGEDFDASKARGKRVFVVPAGAEVPDIASMADYTAGIRQAAAAAGVKTTTCSSHGTVEQWAACLNKAISSKANLVVLVGPVDLVALQAELAALKKAKVPVIAAHVPAPRDFAVGLDPPYERALSSLAAIVPAPFAQGARLMADYVIADANEAPSRILVTGASDMPESNAMVAAVQNELASSCGPSCTVSSLDVPFSTWQTKGYAAIANATLAQPTSYLVSVFDQFDGIAAEGIADARAASAAVIRPNICSFGGTPFAIQMGQAANRVVCDLAENMNWDGWATMDQALRVLTGTAPLASENLPVRLWRADAWYTGGPEGMTFPPTVDAGWGDPNADGGWITGYRDLWGLSASD
jgi:ribose transport system substrate-binding protein